MYICRSMRRTTLEDHSCFTCFSLLFPSLRLPPQRFCHEITGFETIFRTHLLGTTVPLATPTSSFHNLCKQEKPRKCFHGILLRVGQPANPYVKPGDYAVDRAMGTTAESYVEILKTARNNMQRLAQQAAELKPPGTVSTFSARYSYPNGYGPNTALHYVDLRLIAGGNSGRNGRGFSCVVSAAAGEGHDRC